MRYVMKRSQKVGKPGITFIGYLIVKRLESLEKPSSGTS
jgi:hypothetical protein